MAETLEVIRDTLIRIEEKVDGLPNSIRLAATQVIVINGLSDIDVNLGLIMAGEFRAGNQNAPGQGFSGMRMGYPAFTYAGDPWNFVGVENDVMQVGISATDGKLYAGGGVVVLDVYGISINPPGAGYYATSAIKFVNPLYTGESWAIYGSYSPISQSITIQSITAMSGVGLYTETVMLAGTCGAGNIARSSIQAYHLSNYLYKVEAYSSDTVARVTIECDSGALCTFGTSEIILNDGGIDLDVRIKGDTDINLGSFDASRDEFSVGVAGGQVGGGGTPGNLYNAKFHVLAPATSMAAWFEHVSSGYSVSSVYTGALSSSASSSYWCRNNDIPLSGERISRWGGQAVTVSGTFSSAAVMDFFAGENWASGYSAGYIVFSTVPSGGSTTLTEALRIQSDQNVLFAKNAKFTVSPGADHLSSGKVLAFTNHDAVNFGDACYLNSDGEMALADADAIATSSAVGMALSTLSAHSSGDFLMFGIARDDTWAWTVGGLIYLSTTGTTGNTLTQTAPSGTDDVIQILGVATHADRMIFMPNLVQVEHT